MLKPLHTLQDRKIDELKQSLLRYKKVQDMVMSVQAKKGRRRLQMLNTENVIQLLDGEKGLKR